MIRLFQIRLLVLIPFFICLSCLCRAEVVSPLHHLHEESKNNDSLKQQPISGSKVLDQGDLIPTLKDKYNLDEANAQMMRIPGPNAGIGRTSFERATIQNDTGYIYTEAVQLSPVPVYPPIDPDSIDKLNHFFGFVPRFEVIHDWDIRDINIAPGEYKAYNFTLSLNSSQTATYATLAFMSACICTYPNLLENVTDFTDYLTIFTSYGDVSSFGYNDFEDGYFQDQNFASSAPMSTLLYIQAKPLEGFTANSQLDSDVFSLRVGFSANDVPFQWDNSTFASSVDADDDSSLFETGVFNTTSVNATDRTETVFRRAEAMKLQVFKNDESLSFKGLTKSFCAVQRSMDDAVDENTIQRFFTNSTDGYRKKFFVNGLNESTDYVAYVTSDVGGIGQPGVVYNQIRFTTDKADTCELIYGLEFCTDVAYSVPQSSQFAKDKNHLELLQLYDNYAKSVYENFTKAMDQINCYGSSETLFSPFRTCDDCKLSYKSWLCSIVIPRCTTADLSYYKLREVNESRSDFLNNVVQPPNKYYEVMPCIDLCYSIMADCPPQLSFACPDGNSSILQSYGFHDYSDNDNDHCNFVGTGDYIVFNGAEVLAVRSAWVYALLVVGLSFL